MEPKSASHCLDIVTSDATPKPSYRRVVAALAESEDRYRVLVESVRQYAIFMLDPMGIVITWNRGIYELLGYYREEIVGQSGAMLFNAADRAAGVFKKELARAERSGESTIEHSSLRKDGTEVSVHDTTTSLLSSEGDLIGFAKVTRRIRDPRDPKNEAPVELAKVLAALAAEVEHRRQLEAQLLTAVEQERERLGRDLHDDLSQRLAALAIMMKALTQEIKGRSRADRQKAHDIAEELGHAIGVARNLSRGLHPITLTRQGLPAALEELAARVPKHVEFNWPTSERLDLEVSVALHVYRIAEEAVGNAIRHSEGDKITIELQATSARKVALTISDNGKGFQVLDPVEGMGLQNMKYRAHVIGGTLKITSAPGHGTVVKCTLPLRQRQHGIS
jgi:PAS domain S-box-containing protein